MTRRNTGERREKWSDHAPYPPADHKYGAKRTEVDGISFPSKAEAERYLDLKFLQEHGAIRDLELQPRFPIRVNGTLITTYIADFRYFDNDRQEEVVEDVKGFLTDVFKLKKKLVEAVHGVQIVQIKRVKRRGGYEWEMTA